MKRYLLAASLLGLLCTGMLALSRGRVEPKPVPATSPHPDGEPAALGSAHTVLGDIPQAPTQSREDYYFLSPSGSAPVSVPAHYPQY